MITDDEISPMHNGSFLASVIDTPCLIALSVIIPVTISAIIAQRGGNNAVNPTLTKVNPFFCNQICGKPC